MSSSFEDDVIPALRVLSKFIEPQAKALFLLILVVTGFPSLPSWDPFTLPPTYVPALLIAITYFWGIPSLASVASLAGPLQAYQAISKHVGIYFKVGALISLACYIPIHRGMPLAYQPWIYCLFIALVATVGFFAPTPKFYGPLRFGYFEYSQHFTVVSEFIVNSWIYVAIALLFFPWLLPMAGFGLAVTLLAAWVYVYREYRRQVQTVSNIVSVNVSRTQRTVTVIRGYLAAARGYELEILRGAASMRKIAMQANAIRVSDFFDVAAKAWASLDQVTQPVETANEKALALISAADDVEDADKPGEGGYGYGDGDEDGDGDEGGDLQMMAKYLSSSAREAKDRAKEMLESLKAAQNAIRASKNAIGYDERARADAESNAAAAAASALSLGTRVASLLTREFEMTEGGDEVSSLADQAVAAATDGRMTKARELRDAVAAKADQVDALRIEARNTLDLVQGDLLSWLQSSLKSGETVRYSDWDGSTALGV